MAVNRFWQQFFGVGLVKTSEDLGTQGELPSHPELLDYLTVSFIESGWDVKALLKQIVMSKTYRQSSVAPPEDFRKDPENRLLARGSRFRLDAEMIRDQILSTSGLLVGTMYGRSVKPPQPDGLWKAVTMIGERFRADAGESIRRRSLYTYWKRGMPPPQMTVLNAPIRDACTARRERTNTPLQALVLLNDPQFVEVARVLGERVVRHGGDTVEERLAFAFRLATSRRALPIEIHILQQEHADRLREFRADLESAKHYLSGGGERKPPNDIDTAELAAYAAVCSLILNLDESISSS